MHFQNAGSATRLLYGLEGACLSLPNYFETCSDWDKQVGIKSVEHTGQLKPYMFLAV